jgi:glycosyltransferase involved in cell wall biosynthesis
MNQRKLKIAFSVVKNIMRGGGIEKYTLELGRRLVDRGHEVSVFSMGHYGDVPDVVEGMRIVTVPAVRQVAMEKLSAGGFAALRTLNPMDRYDIVHCHSVGAGAFAMLPRLLRQKTVLQMHGIEWQRSRWSPFGRNILKTLEYVSLRTNHALTAVSKTQCDFFLRESGVSMHYIPTGAEIKTILEPEEIAQWGLTRQNYILFASRLVREKGAHYLISAFRKLDTEMKLVIAGDAKGEEGYKDELRALAGDDPRIVFPGFVEGRGLQELFGNAAFYVQPSEIEGLSIALLEAMSFGLCCLVSDIPENREAIGEAGVTFRNMDTEDLLTQMQLLCNMPGQCAKIGEVARARVQGHYSWDLIADRFENLYLDLAG